jgi:predicted nucleic acid-binding protein
MVNHPFTMRLSVVDTTLLSNFAHANRPDLLQTALGKTAVTTATVLSELRQGEAAGLVPWQEWSWLPQTDLTPAEMALAAGYRNVVDAGEADCLAVAVTRNGRFLSDDMAARRLAQAEGIAVSGTLGVLLHLIEQEHLTLAAADVLLAQMRQAGYRAPVSTLRRLLGKT